MRHLSWRGCRVLDLSKFLGGGEWAFLDSVAQRWTQQMSIWLETREMLACTCSFNTRSSSQMKILRPKPSAEDGRGGGGSSLEPGDTLDGPRQILQLSLNLSLQERNRPLCFRRVGLVFWHLQPSLFLKATRSFLSASPGPGSGLVSCKVPRGGSVWTGTT